MPMADRIPSIGPVTEARIQAAFAEACVITAEAACGLIGCDPRTLREMTDAGIIRAVRKGAGKTRGYTEGDIRAYLTESAAPCSPAPSPKPTPTANTKVVSFMARRQAKKR